MIVLSVERMNRLLRQSAGRPVRLAVRMDTMSALDWIASACNESHLIFVVVAIAVAVAADGALEQPFCNCLYLNSDNFIRFGCFLPLAEPNKPTDR